MKNKKLLIKCAASLVVILVGYFFVVRPLWIEQIAELDAEIQESITLLRNYDEKGKTFPSKETLASLEAQERALIERYNIVARFLDARPLEAPEETREPGLYFRERLYTIKKNLASLAKKSSATLPENIGFSDTLPDLKEVPVLLRKLEIANRITEVLLGEGVTDITLIKPLDVLESSKREGHEAGYRVVEVQVAFRSDVQSLVGVLHRISTGIPVIIARDIQSKSLAGKVIETNLVLSHVLTEKLES